MTDKGIVWAIIFGLVSGAVLAVGMFAYNKACGELPCTISVYSSDGTVRTIEAQGCKTFVDGSVRYMDRRTKQEGFASGTIVVQNGREAE